MLKLNCCEAKVGERKCLKVDEYLGAAFLKSLISNAQQPPRRKLLTSVMPNKKPREASKNGADASAWLKTCFNLVIFFN